MVMNKVMCLLICLLFAFSCSTPNVKRPVDYKSIRVIPSAVRTVCIQPDPTQPEMPLVVKPLEEKLSSRGYKVVATPDEAVHTIRLHLTLFDTFRTGNEAARVAASGYKRSSGSLQGDSKNSAMAPHVGWAGGTAVGGAVSGNVLHAGTTTGGAVGGIAGSVLGSLLSVGNPKGPFLYANIDVRISDPVSGEQHTVIGAKWQCLKDPDDPAVMKNMQRLVADDLASKIAALMP
jgi:hypothetical protein